MPEACDAIVGEMPEACDASPGEMPEACDAMEGEMPEACDAITRASILTSIHHARSTASLSADNL